MDNDANDDVNDNVVDDDDNVDDNDDMDLPPTVKLPKIALSISLEKVPVITEIFGAAYYFQRLLCPAKI